MAVSHVKLFVTDVRHYWSTLSLHDAWHYTGLGLGQWCCFCGCKEWYEAEFVHVAHLILCPLCHQLVISQWNVQESKRWINWCPSDGESSGCELWAWSNNSRRNWKSNAWWKKRMPEAVSKHMFCLSTVFHFHSLWLSMLEYVFSGKMLFIGW